jgi:amphi-Trp domain-containing protein
MGSKNKVLMEGAMELKEAVTYLETLVSTLKTETVHMQRGEDAVTLRPTSIVDMKISASQKEGKEKLSIKLGWSSDPKYGLPEDISISGEEPKLDIA